MTQHHPVRTVALAAAFAGLLAVTGCSSSGSKSAANSSGASSSPVSGSSTSGASSSGAAGSSSTDGGPAAPNTTPQTLPSAMPDPDLIIEINNKTYPAEVKVKAGKPIEFHNHDPFQHTFVADDNKTFYAAIPSEVLVQIDAPTTPGTYGFHCSIHPDMKGTLTVE